ncbi:MAG: ArsA family ATPase [Bdellovibrionota bacterium]
MSAASNFQDVLSRKLVFVSGKGGVGKTVVSQAISRALAAREPQKKFLWATFEDPLRPAGELKKVAPNLWEINCEASLAFEEYAAMKIGLGALTRIFLQNKLMRYLSKAAPGIHELVLLGKIWFERQNYHQVIVDMPSTGYGLAMFQSTRNFSQLFRGGPINRDAEAMLATFRSPEECGQLIVSLPEEMPLTEALELRDFLKDLFPENAPAFVVNRLFPETLRPDEEFEKELASPHCSRWESPLARSAEDYARKRATLERYNLRLWENLPYARLPYIPPPTQSATDPIILQLAERVTTELKGVK